MSCGSSCTTTGVAADGFGCVLQANGIPATPTASSSFGYTPANFSTTSHGPPATATTINCNTSYSSSTHQFTTGGVSNTFCSGQTAPSIYSNVGQTGGPNVDILAFDGLTINSGFTLTITGSNAVILAVYGNATIAGTISASAGGTTAGPGGGGPGSNSYCGAIPQDSQNLQFGGGGGGGRAVAGGTGDRASGGSTDSGGAASGSSTGTALVGGCSGNIGGNSCNGSLTGSCTSEICQASDINCSSAGAGGGAVQISASGTVSVTGTITTAGAAGTTHSGCCQAGGGGGGSGGDIVLEGTSVTHGGTLNANGGVGGNGGNGGAAGGAGGTNNGTSQTAPGAGASSNGGGAGGGGSYGYIVISSGKAAPPYTCTTTLSPTPVSNAGHTACLCVADSNCPSGKCSNVNSQCTGTCTGTTTAGTYDAADCQKITSF
jgi:hypothetical protein